MTRIDRMATGALTRFVDSLVFVLVAACAALVVAGCGGSNSGTDVLADVAADIPVTVDVAVDVPGDAALD